MFRVDDTFPEHPKVEQLGSKYPKLFAKCIVLWLFGGCYCARNGTDGVISERRLKALCPHFRVRKEHLKALHEVGLLTPLGDTFQFHDYALYNETKKQKKQRLQQHRDRQKRYRDGKRDASRDDPVTPPSTITSTNTIKKLTELEIENEGTNELESPEWLKVIRCITETTGQTLEPHYHREAAEAVLRLAKQSEPESYLKTISGAVEAWWADEWVSSNRPPPAHLAKNFDRYLNGAGKASEEADRESRRWVRALEDEYKLEKQIGGPRSIDAAKQRWVNAHVEFYGHEPYVL